MSSDIDPPLFQRNPILDHGFHPTNIYWTMFYIRQNCESIFETCHHSPNIHFGLIVNRWLQCSHQKELQFFFWDLRWPWETKLFLWQNKVLKKILTLILCLPQCPCDLLSLRPKPKGGVEPRHWKTSWKVKKEITQCKETKRKKKISHNNDKI